MIIAAVILYWLASIVLWVSILGGIRALQIKKSFSLVASLILSIVFLMMIIRISLHAPVYYMIGGLAFTAFSLFAFPRLHTGWRHALDLLINFMFWPQSICFLMFLYGIGDAEKSA